QQKITIQKRLSQKSNNLAFVIDYVESSISDEGRVFIDFYMRFFITFYFIQNETFETTIFCKIKVKVNCVEKNNLTIDSIYLN
uniref:hypothetical protein n=1 Tax=Chryseobacterium sp. TaxID=1871047 RepID=UPI0023EF7381